MIKEILSKSNPLIKELAKLKQKKYRQKLGLVLVEGERLIKELSIRGATFEYLFFIDDPKVKVGGELVKTNREVLLYLSQTVTTPDIIGVIKWENQAFSLPQTNFLVLDNISDPGNLGTLIRSALAFNFKYIYLLNCVDYTSDKVLRSTMGTVLDVKIVECDYSDIDKLASKHTLILADMEGKILESYPKSDEKIGIVLGNEANGVSETLRSKVKNKIAIAMKNNVESLNVAIAGSIIMNYFKGE
ncbi:MAG: RNA methyltransferase [Clostridia bacterium]|nr:RNA methyltransferase [Clostridia bacterium]